MAVLPPLILTVGDLLISPTFFRPGLPFCPRTLLPQPDLLS